MTVLDAPVAPPAEAVRATRLRVVVPALVVALVAGVLGWSWVAHRPQVAEGTTSRTLDLRTVGDGFQETRYVVPPGGGRLLVSVRNTSPLPVTVGVAPQPYPEHAFLEVEGLRRGASGSSLETDGPWRSEVRLGADEQATVSLRLAQARCVPLAAGSSTTLHTVPLRLSWLGVTTVAEHRLLPLPVTFPGPHTPPADCA